MMLMWSSDVGRDIPADMSALSAEGTGYVKGGHFALTARPPTMFRPLHMPARSYWRRYGLQRLKRCRKTPPSPLGSTTRRLRHSQS